MREWLLAFFIATTPAAAPPSPPIDGPRCTTVYPRGFTVPRNTKKSPTCKNGDLEATWRGCTKRHNA